MAKGDQSLETPVEPAPPPAVRLDRSPSHLLHRALQHALDVYAEAVGEGAITQRQFAVLTAVDADEGLTQTGLVRATGIDRSTLADMVARMIAKGLLARERSATDGRANTVRLTDEGRSALEAAAPKVVEADERILAPLSGKQRDSFLKTLALLAAAEAGGEAVTAEAFDGQAEVAAPGKKRKQDKGDKAERGDKKKKKKPKKG